MPILGRDSSQDRRSFQNTFQLKMATNIFHSCQRDHQLAFPRLVSFVFHKRSLLFVEIKAIKFRPKPKVKIMFLGNILRNLDERAKISDNS